MSVEDLVDGVILPQPYK